MSAKVLVELQLESYTLVSWPLIGQVWEFSNLDHAHLSCNEHSDWARKGCFLLRPRTEYFKGRPFLHSYTRFSSSIKLCDCSLDYHIEMAPNGCQYCSKYFQHKKNLIRHVLTHQAASYRCVECQKVFLRSDYLHKHHKICKSKGKQEVDKIFKCKNCGKTFGRKDSLKRHTSICKNHDVKLYKEMEEESLVYQEKVSRGEKIDKYLKQYPHLVEDGLAHDKLSALKTYQYSISTDLNVDEVVLKPWQKIVFDMIDHPSDRTLIWIIGTEGNEGKTFLQKYIKQIYGTRRVLKTELNARKSDVAYMLSQTSLTCKDIFLFNLLRSDAEVAYGLLENIKDGYLVSVKYKTKEVKIKIPNVVMVFSNDYPDEKQLSKDRWEVYTIDDDELEMAYPQKRSDFTGYGIGDGKIRPLYSNGAVRKTYVD